MTKQLSDHAIPLDEKSRKQPTDEDRAQTTNKTQPGRLAPLHKSPTDQDDEIQPLREKSGF